MDSFDGSRRRDGRPPLSPAERRSPREPEPLEQRLDRWMSTGRQLVEGVSGGRPGSRAGGRRPEGRPGTRGGFDGLGRWVEDRLDWLLDDSDDWPEPWQESGRRPADPAGSRRPAPQAPAPEQPRAAWSAAERMPQTRRRLEAISRRGSSGQPAAAQAPAPVPQASDPQDWPDDSVFDVPRWQRPSAPLRRRDPLQAELEQRGREPVNGAAPQPGSSARPLPRSSRRR